MNGRRRLAICYVVPGHDLVAAVGPTRNVLNVAHELGKWADVTVAFRRVLEPIAQTNFFVTAIDPRPLEAREASGASLARDDFSEFARYTRSVRRMAIERLPAYDVVLEQHWRLTGMVTHWCTAQGIPAIPLLNVGSVPAAPWRTPLRAVRHATARAIRGYHLRRAPLMVAESHALKRAMVQEWRVPSERVEVITLGVDHSIFHPQPQERARIRLGIAQRETMLLYVGGLDGVYDLKPVIEAIVRTGHPTIRLHVIGDGKRRGHLEHLAGHAGQVLFHGVLPYRDVPTYIAAADLCLVPCRSGHFPTKEMGHPTLKAREYLAAGRPVAVAPADVLPELIQHGVNGYSLENEPLAWIQLLQRKLPSRERLRSMGLAAAATRLSTWEDTARAYYALCERIARRPPVVTPPITTNEPPSSGEAAAGQ